MVIGEFPTKRSNEADKRHCHAEWHVTIEQERVDVAVSAARGAADSEETKCSGMCESEQSHDTVRHLANRKSSFYRVRI